MMHRGKNVVPEELYVEACQERGKAQAALAAAEQRAAEAERLRVTEAARADAYRDHMHQLGAERDVAEQRAAQAEAKAEHAHAAVDIACSWANTICQSVLRAHDGLEAERDAALAVVAELVAIVSSVTRQHDSDAMSSAGCLCDWCATKRRAAALLDGKGEG